ncbi:MAG: hypothetical protein AAF662_06545 [Pseudomonadota bacterium]
MSTYGIDSHAVTGIVRAGHQETAKEALETVLTDPEYRQWLNLVQDGEIPEQLARKLSFLMKPLAAYARPQIAASGNFRWKIDLPDIQALEVEIDGRGKRLIESAQRNADLASQVAEEDGYDDTLEHEFRVDAAMHKLLVVKQREQLQEAVRAFRFSFLLNENALRHLKQCQSDICNDYFIGGPRAKWCSDACGSAHRMRKKRRRDKGAQSLESRYL